MLREFTCIICPNGCEITAQVCEHPDGSRTAESITGALCPRGKAYVEQELTAPMRTISTSVLVEGGELPLASVRLSAPIPKERIFDAMEQIRPCVLTAPVKAGTVVIKGILGYDSDVIVTKNVERKK